MSERLILLLLRDPPPIPRAKRNPPKYNAAATGKVTTAGPQDGGSSTSMKPHFQELGIAYEVDRQRCEQAQEIARTLFVEGEADGRDNVPAVQRFEEPYLIGFIAGLRCRLAEAEAGVPLRRRQFCQACHIDLGVLDTEYQDEF